LKDSRLFKYSKMQYFCMQSRRRFGASMQPITLALFRSMLPIGTLIMLSCSSPDKATRNGDAMIFQTKTVQVPDSQDMKPLGMTGHDMEIRLALAKRYKEVEAVQIALSSKAENAFLHGKPENEPFDMRKTLDKLLLFGDQLILIGKALNGDVDGILKQRTEILRSADRTMNYEYVRILDEFDLMTENRYKPQNESFPDRPKQ